MKRELLSGYESIAYGAMLSGVEFIPYHPSQFSSKIMKKIANVKEFESSSSATTAAIASAFERRTFLTSFSEELYEISALRLPVVMVSDNAFALRDLGYFIFLPESNQEILDTVIQAYRISEERMIPTVINIDFPGFREPVSLPSDRIVKNFLPKFKPRKGFVEKDNEVAIQIAMRNSLKIIEKINEKWKMKFKRNYGFFEKYYMDDAEYAFVVSGFYSSTAKSAVNKLRQQGEKIGLLRLRVYRPFPADMIKGALKDKRIALIEQKISLGSSGILYPEIRSCSGFCSDFLAAKYMNEKDFIDIFNRLKKSEKEERIWVD